MSWLCGVCGADLNFGEWHDYSVPHVYDDWEAGDDED